MLTTNTAHQELINAWRAQARNKPWLTLSFAGCIVLILLLLLVTAYQGMHLENFHYALSAGTAGFIATIVGASLIFFTRTVSVRIQDALLGFAAGMMLAASAFSLILPGIEAAEELFEQRTIATAIVVFGLGLGTLLML